MNAVQLAERNRWWRVAYVLGGIQADIARMSNVARQTVGRYISASGYNVDVPLQDKVSAEKLLEYRAIYDRFKTQLDFMSIKEAALFVIERDTGVKQEVML